MSDTSRFEGGLASTQGSDTQNPCTGESGNAGGRSGQSVDLDAVVFHVVHDGPGPMCVNLRVIGPDGEVLSPELSVEAKYEDGVWYVPATAIHRAMTSTSPPGDG